MEHRLLLLVGAVLLGACGLGACGLSSVPAVDAAVPDTLVGEDAGAPPCTSGAECEEVVRVLADDARSFAVARSESVVWILAAQDPDPVLYQADPSARFEVSSSNSVVGTPTDILVRGLAAFGDSVVAAIETMGGFELLWITPDGDITSRVALSPELTAIDCMVAMDEGVVVAGSTGSGTLVEQFGPDSVRGFSESLGSAAKAACSRDDGAVVLAVLDQGEAVITYRLGTELVLTEVARFPVPELVFDLGWARGEVLALMDDRIRRLGPGVPVDVALPCLPERSSAPQMSVAADATGVAIGLFWDTAERVVVTGRIPDGEDATWTVRDGVGPGVPEVVSEAPLHGIFYRDQEALTFLGVECL